MWETLLQEVEVDSVVAAETAHSLGRHGSRPLVEGIFHRKLEARKIFQHREALENALEKAGTRLDSVSRSSSSRSPFSRSTRAIAFDADVCARLDRLLERLRQRCASRLDSGHRLRRRRVRQTRPFAREAQAALPALCK